MVTVTVTAVPRQICPIFFPDAQEDFEFGRVSSAYSENNIRGESMGVVLGWKYYFGFQTIVSVSTNV